MRERRTEGREDGRGGGGGGRINVGVSVRRMTLLDDSGAHVGPGRGCERGPRERGYDPNSSITGVDGIPIPPTPQLPHARVRSE